MQKNVRMAMNVIYIQTRENKGQVHNEDKETVNLELCHICSRDRGRFFCFVLRMDHSQV